MSRAVTGVVPSSRLRDYLPVSAGIHPRFLNHTLHQGATVRNQMLKRTGWLAAVLLTLTMLWPAPALAVLATLTDDTWVDAAAPLLLVLADEAGQIRLANKLPLPTSGGQVEAE